MEESLLARWEYQVLRYGIKDDVKFDTEEITNSLNLWGAEGWELVSTETIARRPNGGSLYFVATLKRKI